MAVEHDGHRIEIRVDRLWGGQVVSYDGEKVARKRTVGDTTIDFVVVEDGERVVYEVLTSVEFLKFKDTNVREVRRNGQPVYELWRDRLSRSD